MRWKGPHESHALFIFELRKPGAGRGFAGRELGRLAPRHAAGCGGGDYLGSLLSEYNDTKNG